MRISDWSSDVCSSDLSAGIVEQGELQVHAHHEPCGLQVGALPAATARAKPGMALRQRRAAPGAQAGACLLQRDLLLAEGQGGRQRTRADRKSTRLNSSH